MLNKCRSRSVCLCGEVTSVSVRVPRHDGVLSVPLSGAIKDVVNCKLVRQRHNWQLKHGNICFVLRWHKLNSGSLGSRRRKSKKIQLELELVKERK